MPQPRLLLFGLVLGWSGTLAPAQDPSASAPAGGAVFAEDFESGELDENIWARAVTGGNRITVQQEQVAHGRFALRVSCPEPSNRTWAFILARQLPATLRQHHFGRAYLYVTPRPPARHTILIMAGTGGFPQNKFLEVATTNRQWQLTYVDLQPAGDREDYHIGGGDVPLNRWFCLEWEFNDQPDHVAIRIDGQPVYETGFVSKRTGAVTDLIGGFTEAAFGFRLWGAAPERFDIYYDDIALATEPIGRITVPPDAKE